MANVDQHECSDCHATWLGDSDCRWCSERVEREQAARIANVLYPLWMVQEGPRFDELGPIDQEIWKVTRGTKLGAWGAAEWSDALYDAMHDGLISKAQAIGAMERFGRWQKKSTQSNASMRDTKPT